MIKDSIVNIKKSLRTTLQNVPAVVDTLIRGLDEVEDAAEVQNTYSTDERVVGKWIDGSDVYEKIVDCGAIPNDTVKSVPHGITGIGKFISCTVVSNSTTEAVVLPHTFGNGDFANFYLNNVNIEMKCIGDRSSFSNTHAILRYTKSAASRSPENDTKNGGEDEPDVKTVEDLDVKTVEDPDIKLP